VKTGTTNDFRDAWTMGYTPQLAAGVWVGRNDHAPMNKGTDGSKIAAPIWQKFMLGALKGKEVKAFPRPEIPKTGKPILDGDFIGVNRVKIDKFTKKLATQFTPEDYITEVSFGGFHNILYYIDRNNPLGPPPNNPEQDPQYKNWEQAVFNWWKDSKKITQLSIPPLDYDDVHLPENIPQIKILSPADGAVVIEDSINVDVDVKAPRGITKVEYYFDDDFRESAGGPPFSRTIYFGSLKKVQNGAHVITVKASDDAGNRNKAVVNIELKRETADNQEVPKIITAPNVSIVYPIDGAVISNSTFPVFVQLNIKSPSMIRRVDLYYNDKENNPIILDSQKDSLTENLNLDWVDAPPAGTYSLFVIWIDKNGRSYRNEVKVTIL
jgi:membrane peptidoglycan carboxypeptidase